MTPHRRPGSTHKQSPCYRLDTNLTLSSRETGNLIKRKMHQDRRFSNHQGKILKSSRKMRIIHQEESRRKESRVSKTKGGGVPEKSETCIHKYQNTDFVDKIQPNQLQKVYKKTHAYKGSSMTIQNRRESDRASRTPVQSRISSRNTL